MYRPSLAVLTGVVVVVVGAACGGETESASSQQDYVSANERLLETLPRFPGVREVSRSSAAYYAGDSGDSPAAGYTTNVVYAVRSGVDQGEVVEFYVTRLKAWTSRLEYQPGVDVQTGGSRPGAWVATLTRGGALVGVNTDNMAAPSGRRFELVVDHAGAAR